MFRTHIVVGFLAALFLIEHINYKNQILFTALVVIGSLLPDIDHPKSKIGKNFKIISMFFEHRGFFHSLFVMPLLALIIFYLTRTNYYSIPLLTGYLSHIVMDLLTKEGVMLFHPLSKMRIRGLVKTGGILEKILFFIILSFTILYLLNF
ncbi:MAG: metal-dependent hydrolase [Candidatus Woesearchaeota archaeon]